MSNAALSFHNLDATTHADSRIQHPDLRSALPDATGGSVIDWMEMLDRYSRHKRTYPIWSIKLDHRPFKVSVYRNDRSWFAENEEYNVLGQGDSVAAALRDAIDAIHYLASELINEPDLNLSDYAQTLKYKYLRLSFD